jgi:hypothetical protein
LLTRDLHRAPGTPPAEPMFFEILSSGRSQLQAIPEYAFNFKDSQSDCSYNNTAIQTRVIKFPGSIVFCPIKSLKDKIFSNNLQANFRENYFYWLYRNHFSENSRFSSWPFTEPKTQNLKTIINPCKQSKNNSHLP